MSPGILGKKVGMTQVYRPDGRVVPVTVLRVGPCVVVQRKTATQDGYEALQLGLAEFVKPSRVNRPMAGHYKKNGVEPAKFLLELHVRGSLGSDLKAADRVLASEFRPAERVD